MVLIGADSFVKCMHKLRIIRLFKRSPGRKIPCNRLRKTPGDRCETNSGRPIAKRERNGNILPFHNCHAAFVTHPDMYSMRLSPITGIAHLNYHD